MSFCCCKVIRLNYFVMCSITPCQTWLELYPNAKFGLEGIKGSCNSSFNSSIYAYDSRFGLGTMSSSLGPAIPLSRGGMVPLAKQSRY